METIPSPGEGRCSLQNTWARHDAAGEKRVIMRRGFVLDLRDAQVHLRWTTFRKKDWLANHSSFDFEGGPPSRFALRWATFASIHERRLVRPGGN